MRSAKSKYEDAMRDMLPPAGTADREKIDLGLSKLRGILPEMAEKYFRGKGLKTRENWSRGAETLYLWLARESGYDWVTRKEEPRFHRLPNLLKLRKAAGSGADVWRRILKRANLIYYPENPDTGGISYGVIGYRTKRNVKYGDAMLMREIAAGASKGDRFPQRFLLQDPHEDGPFFPNKPWCRMEYVHRAPEGPEWEGSWDQTIQARLIQDWFDTGRPAGFEAPADYSGWLRLAEESPDLTREEAYRFFEGGRAGAEPDPAADIAARIRKDRAAVDRLVAKIMNGRTRAKTRERLEKELAGKAGFDDLARMPEKLAERLLEIRPEIAPPPAPEGWIKGLAGPDGILFKELVEKPKAAGLYREYRGITQTKRAIRKKILHDGRPLGELFDIKCSYMANLVQLIQVMKRIHDPLAAAVGKEELARFAEAAVNGDPYSDALRRACLDPYAQADDPALRA